MNSRRLPSHWTPQQDDLLRELWGDMTLTQQEIADRVGRSVHALDHRRERLGLPTRARVLRQAASWWTAERNEELLRRWNDGQSATEICRAMDAASRNAVIGRLTRMGMKREQPAKPARVSPPPKPKAPKAKRSAPRVTHIRPTTPEAVTLANDKRAIFADYGKSLITAPQEVPATARPWLERGPAQCAWPVSGDGADTWSCCAPVAAPGATYCGFHFSRSIQSGVSFQEAARRAEAKAKDVLRKYGRAA